MIIVMKHGAGQREIEAVEKVLRDHNNLRDDMM